MMSFERQLARRRWLREAANGSLLIAFGGLTYIINDELTREAAASPRKDGKPRVPPGQRVIEALKPMGGTPGDPRRSQFRLKVHGDVEKPFELDFGALMKLPQVSQKCDVHCVTGWTVLDAVMEGVRVTELAQRAQLKPGVRHVIFEAAHGYTANVRLSDAMKPNVLIAHRHDGAALARTHGGPVRSLVPDLYFWKSAKWLTGVRFSRRDAPGYWETRGYNNFADPWLEQRYS